MKITRLNNIPATTTLLERLRIKKISVGFVPTMGALHAGHLALVERCKKENDLCVVSIFVNPIQFNNPEDFKNYPRDAEQDAAMLESVGCDILFEPSTEEMYPVPDNSEYQFGGLEMQMEGRFRPGHFNGVAIVVRKLFDIVQPDQAYFGEKDYQQLLIVNRLVSDLQLDIEIVPCAIVREEDGLAMSSRNRRLDAGQRACASGIPRIMQTTKAMAATHTPDEIRKWVREECERTNCLKLDYFEIADPTSLTPLGHWLEHKAAMGFIAVFVGQIRLIDNIRYY